MSSQNFLVLDFMGVYAGSSSGVDLPHQESNNTSGVAPFPPHSQEVSHRNLESEKVSPLHGGCGSYSCGTVSRYTVQLSPPGERKQRASLEVLRESCATASSLLRRQPCRFLSFLLHQAPGNRQCKRPQESLVRGTAAFNCTRGLAPGGLGTKPACLIVDNAFDCDGSPQKKQGFSGLSAEQLKALEIESTNAQKTHIREEKNYDTTSRGNPPFFFFRVPEASMVYTQSLLWKFLWCDTAFLLGRADRKTVYTLAVFCTLCDTQAVRATDRLNRRGGGVYSFLLKKARKTAKRKKARNFGPEARIGRSGLFQIPLVDTLFLRCTTPCGVMSSSHPTSLPPVLFRPGLPKALM